VEEMNFEIIRWEDNTQTIKTISTLTQFADSFNVSTAIPIYAEGIIVAGKLHVMGGYVNSAPLKSTYAIDIIVKAIF